MHRTGLIRRSRPVHHGLMRWVPLRGTVRVDGRARGPSTIMKRINLLALALAAAAAPLCIVLSAKADLAQQTGGPPVVTIRSQGGQITVRSGEPDGIVRVPGNAPGVQMSHFNVSAQEIRMVFPGERGQAGGNRGGRRPYSFPARPFNVPNLNEGPHGVAIVNPGNDLTVGVPNKTEAMFINAGPSPVTMEQTHGPFVIFGQGDIALHGVQGRGWVRTPAGNMDIRDPSGALRLETATGRIAMQSGAALDRAEIYSQNGDVEWTINGAGSGPYRIIAGSGIVRLFVRPGIGVNIDASSDTGTVVNNLGPGIADVSLARPHALSLTMGGGGAEITVHSVGATVIIAPSP